MSSAKDTEVITLSDDDDEAGGVQEERGKNAMKINANEHQRKQPPSGEFIKTRSKTAAKTVNGSANVQNSRSPILRQKIKRPHLPITAEHFKFCQKRPRLEPISVDPKLLANVPFSMQQVQAEIESEQMLNLFISSMYYESREKTGGHVFEGMEGASPGSPDENPPPFGAAFRCTFGKCRRWCRNNITFMHHLWAHVVSMKSPSILADSQECWNRVEKNRAEKTDLEQLKTCPQCLNVQDTPFQMQIHYHRVHKRRFFNSVNLSVCQICECVLPRRHLVEHIKREHLQYAPGENHCLALENGDFEFPYQCKLCPYKTTYRHALLAHFTAKHRETAYCLCPFCLTAFKLSNISAQTKRPGAKVKFRLFVDHIKSHVNSTINADEYYRHKCESCCVKLVPTSSTNIVSRKFDESIEAAASNHRQQHQINKQPMKQQFKSHEVCKEIGTLKAKPSQMKNMDEFDFQCLECAHLIFEQRSSRKATQKGFTTTKHFSYKPLKCQHCPYTTNCRLSFDLHGILSICNPKNASRWPFGVQSTVSSAPFSMLKCMQCDQKALEPPAQSWVGSPKKSSPGKRAKIQWTQHSENCQSSRFEIIENNADNDKQPIGGKRSEKKLKNEEKAETNDLNENHKEKKQVKKEPTKIEQLIEEMNKVLVPPRTGDLINKHSIAFLSDVFSSEADDRMRQTAIDDKMASILSSSAFDLKTLKRQMKSHK